MTADSSSEDRLVRIETALAHLQQDVESLNASLLLHLQKIQTFETRCAKIEAAVQQISDGPENRDPDLEKPPHY